VTKCEKGVFINVLMELMCPPVTSHGHEMTEASNVSNMEKLLNGKVEKLQDMKMNGVYKTLITQRNTTAMNHVIRDIQSVPSELL